MRSTLTVLFLGMVLLTSGCIVIPGETEIIATSPNATITPSAQPLPSDSSADTLPELLNESSAETMDEPSAETSIIAEMATVTYTDPRGKLSLERPLSWRVKTETQKGFEGLTVDFADPNYPDDKIRLTYTRTALTLDEEEAQLQRSGQQTTRITIRGQEYVVYETEFEPLPNQRLRERTAVTVKDTHIYRLSLIAKPANFEMHLPFYTIALESLELS